MLICCGLLRKNIVPSTCVTIPNLFFEFDTHKFGNIDTYLNNSSNVCIKTFGIGWFLKVLDGWLIVTEAPDLQTRILKQLSCICVCVSKQIWTCVTWFVLTPIPSRNFFQRQIHLQYVKCIGGYGIF